MLPKGFRLYMKIKKWPIVIIIIIILMSNLFSGCIYNMNNDKKNRSPSYLGLGAATIFSPDGQHIVFEDYFENEGTWIIDIDGNNRKKISEQRVYLDTNFISNNELLFSSNKEILAMNITNGKIYKIVDGYDYSLSFDKTKIVYKKSRENYTYSKVGIYSLITNYENIINISGGVNSPIFNINNTQIIYTNFEYIFRFDIKTKKKTLITEGGGAIETSVGYNLKLSPDGERILFYLGNHEIKEGMYLTDLNGTEVTKIADAHNFPKFHPNRDEIYYRGIYKNDFTGKNESVVINSDYQWTFDINPNGDKLIYCARKERDSQIYYMWLMEI